MIGEPGTPECAQCAHRRSFEERCAPSHTIRHEVKLWEDEPCIDLKKQIGAVLISTVFLHTSHNYSGCGEPIFYETQIFENTQDDCLGDEIYCNRYSSKQEAIMKHNIIVAFLDKQTPEEFVEWIKLIKKEHEQ